MPNPVSRRRAFLTAAAAMTCLKASQAADAPQVLPTATAAPNPDRDAINVEKDIVFGKGGDRDLRLDIYNPTGNAPAKRTAIIHLHGGRWAVGDKSGLAAQLQRVAALGYVNIAAQYRLSGVARWPAQIEDVKTAIRWTRANATRLGVDPSRIVVAGNSAGGYLALFAAGTQNDARYEGSGGQAGLPTTVSACLSYFAPTGVAAGPMFRQALPLPPGSGEEAWQEVEIDRHLKGMPPTIIFQGFADTLVAPEVSEALSKQLRTAGVACELHEFGGVSHEFVQFPEFATVCAQLSDSFLDRYVVHPRTYPAFVAGRAAGA